MNLNHIRKRVVGEFRPFRITTAAGSRYRVASAESIAIGRSVVVIVGRNDSSVKIDAPDITEIEDLPQRKRL
jgi:hypothetical protein